MSNGIRVDLMQYPEGDIKFVLTMFLDNEDKTWIEFDREQFAGLINLFNDQVTEYEALNADKPDETSSD